MAYRFKHRRRLESEVRRVLDRQLSRAIDALAADPPAPVVHEARRRIKKARALLQLIRPSLGTQYDALDRDLEGAIRLLAPIADAGELPLLLERGHTTWAAALPARAYLALLKQMLQRARLIDGRTTAAHVLPRTVARLTRARAAAAGLALGATGFRAVAPGLTRSVRRAQKAMRVAQEEPTAAHMCRWRRRVKDLWFELRLLEQRCGGRIDRDISRLERLDGVLGEYKNGLLLERAVEGMLHADAAASFRRMLAARQAVLRRRAARLGAVALQEAPTLLTARVQTYWRLEWRAPQVKRQRCLRVA